MRQKYNLNIDDDSKWLISTPAESAKALPFHIVEFGHFICQSNFFTERSGKNALLLIYTLSGKGYLKFMKQEYILKPNSVVLINCEKYQYFKTLSEEPWEEKFIHFNGRAAKEFYHLLNPEDISVIEISDVSYFNKMMDETADFFEFGDITTHVRASLHMTKILTFLIEQKFEHPKSLGLEQKRFSMEKSIEYMKKNYKERISIDMLAQDALLSKYYFIKMFNAVCGTSPYGYLMNIRINAAKRLLVTTHLTVKDIAFESGFTNSNNFIKAFKKITGMTPMEYKRSF